MRRRETTAHRTAALLATALFAAAKSLAEEPAPARRIVVSIADCKLALIENGTVVKIYQTAVGAPRTPSPAGAFQVVQRIPNPTWYGPGKVVAPGPANPLGTRWIGLSRKSYGIHGTNNPRSIGRRASHGCIRMRNSDVEELFERVSPGDIVELHASRTPELETIFGTALAAGAAGGQ